MSSIKNLLISTCFLALLVFGLAACDSSEPSTGLDDIVDINYQLNVQPIFDAKCIECHGSSRSENGLRLSSWAPLVEGADNGEVVIPFNSENSVLIEMASKWAKGSHPSELNRDALSAEEIRFLRRWIDEGAKSLSGIVSGSDAENLLYVCNQADATVSIIDTDTGRVIRVVDLNALGFGADASPHMVAVEADKSAWYVSLIGANKVVKFDRDNTVVGSADFETPGMVSLLPNSNKLYVARSFTAQTPPTSIGSINTSDMSINLIDVVVDRPHALIVDPNGKYVITASLNANQIVSIDPRTDQVIGTAIQPDPPAVYVQGAVNGEGTILYMTGQVSNELSIFDIGDPSAIVKIGGVETADDPWHPVVTDNDAFVFFGNQKSNNIYFVSTASGSVGGAINGIGVAEPHGSAVSAAGKIYISNQNTINRYIPRFDFGDNASVGTVVEIDPSLNQITRVIEVGNRATGIAATK